MNKIIILLLTITAMSCNKPEKADAIFHNGTIYTVDDQFRIAGAMAVKDNKILAVGTDDEILNKYQADEITDLNGKPGYPGFIDAHCHLYWYGKSRFDADLKGTSSFDEVLERLKKHTDDYQTEWLVGRGWDQNNWEVKEFPSKEKLDSLFPDKPVLITRIDGHAALANQKALDLAGVNESTEIDGGIIEKKKGKLTGLLVDNAIELVSNTIPAPDREDHIKFLRKAQADCFDVGLTSVVDAGLDKDLILLIDSMMENEELKIRIYSMLSDTEENQDHFKKPFKKDHFHVGGYKFYSDGALGSRGARLLEPYADKPEEKGLFLKDTSYFEKRYRECYDQGFQVHTHAIGDAANRMVLEKYAAVLEPGNDRRWRLEHCQVIHPDDLHYFKEYNIIPSLQPTHATSDMYWADERLGPERIKTAYAFKDLLNAAGMIAGGSDFPIEDINPLYGFYAAVARKDHKGYPEGGFQMENALTREEALKAMTIWAAYSVFEENMKGSLEPGKWADFVVLDRDIMKVSPEEIIEAKVLATYVDGKVVE